MTARNASWTRILVALTTAALFTIGAGTALAASKGKKAPRKKGPAVTKVVGDVSKMANKKGKITGAQIKCDDGKIYNVILDKKGMTLAKSFDGKKVDATGIVSKKKRGKKINLWLRVRESKEAEPAEPADEGGDEGGE